MVAFIPEAIVPVDLTEGTPEERAALRSAQIHEWLAQHPALQAKCTELGITPETVLYDFRFRNPRGIK